MFSRVATGGNDQYGSFAPRAALHDSREIVGVNAVPWFKPWHATQPGDIDHHSGCKHTVGERLHGETGCGTPSSDLVGAKSVVKVAPPRHVAQPIQVGDVKTMTCQAIPVA